jgi:hypothetical protein
LRTAHGKIFRVDLFSVNQMIERLHLGVLDVRDRCVGVSFSARSETDLPHKRISHIDYEQFVRDVHDRSVDNDDDDQNFVPAFSFARLARVTTAGEPVFIKAIVPQL